MLWGSGNDVFVFCRVVLLKHRLMAHILMGSRTSIKISSLKAQLHIQILINKTVRLWFRSQTLSGPPFAMYYLRVICIVLDIIIAGIIRWNTVTESSWISCSELLRDREGRFGKPQTLCCWLPNSVFGGSLSQNCVRSTLWWTIKDANGRSLME